MPRPPKGKRKPAAKPRPKNVRSKNVTVKQNVRVTVGGGGGQLGTVAFPVPQPAAPPVIFRGGYGPPPPDFGTHFPWESGAGFPAVRRPRPEVGNTGVPSDLGRITTSVRQPHLEHRVMERLTQTAPIKARAAETQT